MIAINDMNEIYSLSSIIERLVMYFEYPFVRYALIVSVLTALSSSLLGVTLVLKRFSFIGDGLSHVAFGALAIATAMKLTNSFLVALPITIICAVLLLQAGQNTKIKGDAAIAMISVGALAIGYFVMNLSSTSINLAGDVCTALFGATSLLTLDKTMVWLCCVLSILVVVAFLVFYNKIFAVTFDEDFSAATGINAKVYNIILAVIIAVVIVLAMNLVGALLISALVIFPALSAMQVFKSFKAVTICSVIFSVICSSLGMLVAIAAYRVPVGSTIVIIDIAGFFIFCLIGLIARHGLYIALPK